METAHAFHSHLRGGPPSPAKACSFLLIRPALGQGLHCPVPAGLSASSGAQSPSQGSAPASHGKLAALCITFRLTSFSDTPARVGLSEKLPAAPSSAPGGSPLLCALLCPPSYKPVSRPPRLGSSSASSPSSYILVLLTLPRGPPHCVSDLVQVSRWPSGPWGTSHTASSFSWRSPDHQTLYGTCPVLDSPPW